MAAVMASMPNIGPCRTGLDTCSVCCQMYLSPGVSSKRVHPRSTTVTGQGLGKYAGCKVDAFKPAGPPRDDRSGSRRSNGSVNVQQAIPSTINSNAAEKLSLAGQKSANVPIVPGMDPRQLALSPPLFPDISALPIRKPVLELCLTSSPNPPL